MVGVVVVILFLDWVPIVSLVSRGDLRLVTFFLEFQSIHQGKETYLYYAGQSEALAYRVLNCSRQNMIKSRQIRARKLSHEDSSALSDRPAGRLNLHLLSDSSVNSAVFRP